MLAVVVLWRAERIVAAHGGVVALALAGCGLAGAAALAVLALVAVRRGRSRRPGRRAGSGAARAGDDAEWAKVGDLNALRVRAVERGRMVIGRVGRRTLLAVERGQSLVVIGPTQSLKTSGVAVPAILEWDGPVVATSVKTDLARDTVRWREGLGSVLVYDPAAATGLPRAGWSPLTTSTSWPAARRVAAALCSVGRPASAGVEDAGFWYAMAEKLLAPLLFAAASVGATMADLCRWVDTEETSEVMLALELTGVGEATRAAAASFGREERQRSSVFATLESVLAAFSDPSVLASTESNEIVPDRLLDGRSGTLYLCAPSHEQERLQPVFVAILRQVLDAAFERAAAAGAPLDPPLLVVLDEAANVAPIAELDRLAATAAGHGVQLVTVFQDLAQVEARYGSRAGTVVNNHRAKLILSGVSDPATLEHVSRLLGDEERWSSSMSLDPYGGWSQTHSAQTRPLAPAASLRRIEPGEGVLVYGHLPPARVVLRPWFSDPDLRRRVAP